MTGENAVDREALEHGLVRRLLDHIENRTTDLADGVLEVPTDAYSVERHEEELQALFRDSPIVFCLSGALPEPASYYTVDLCGVPILLTRDVEGQVRAL